LLAPAGDAPPSVEGLTVTAQRGGGASVSGQSDAEGRFRLAVPTGTLVLSVEAPGLRRLERVFGVTAALDESQAVDLGDLRLEFARGGVRGRVSYADGATAADTTVSLSGGPARALALVDAEGRFEFTEVRGGTYQLAATRFGYIAEPVAVDIVDARFADPEPVVVMTPQPGVLCGQVVFPAGAGDPPVAAAPTLQGCPPPAQDAVELDATARVVVAAQGGASAPIYRDGYFRIELRAGATTLDVRRDGYRAVTLRNEFVAPGVGQARSLGQVALDFERGSVQGVVELLGDCPETDTPVSVFLVNGPENVAPFPALIPGRQSDPGCAQTSPFSFVRVRAGRYALEARSADYRLARVEDVAITNDGNTILAAPIALSVNPGVVEAVVAAEGVRLSADDVDCADVVVPEELAAISLTLDGTRFRGVPDCHGRVMLNDPELRAGTYTARFTGGDAYRTQVVPTVTVQPGRTSDLGRFELAYARNSIFGRVTTDDGASAQNAIVLLDGPESGVAYADAEGNFSFFNVRAGGEDYTLRASLDGYAQASATVRLTRDQAPPEVPLDLVLDPGAVSGRVIAEGSDGADFDVRVASTPPRAARTTAGGGGELPGAFSVDNLRKGTYSISVTQGARFRARTLPAVQIVPGVTLDLGDVEVQRAAGRVALAVQVADAARLDADALANTYGTTSVVLEPSDADDPFLPRYAVNPNAQGRVEFSSVWVGLVDKTSDAFVWNKQQHIVERVFGGDNCVVAFL
jgi:hypothetical protein